MSIRVVRPGAFTTVQDLGRQGWQHDGVPVGGAMDGVALRLANWLVGNPADSAALEATLTGPTLCFERDAVVAIAGADCDARVAARPLRPWHATRVRAGETLAMGPARRGCRAYLAVAGGIDVPTVLGSRATYVRAAIGGYEGRALRAGDLLAVGAATGAHLHHAVDVRGLDLQRATVRYVAGPHHALLTDEARRLLATAPFRLAPGSDRMGLRFEGASLALRAPVEPLSAGVAMGTMQLPPGGAPIVLMADRQTTGGYPCIGGVAAVDLPALAQLRPGEAVRFEEVSLEAAEALYLVRERELDRIRRLLAMPP